MMDLTGAQVVLGVQVAEIVSPNKKDQHSSKLLEPPKLSQIPPIDRVLARFDKLKHIRHSHLAQHVDVLRGHTDTIYVATEHYTTSLHTRLKAIRKKRVGGNLSGSPGLSESELCTISYQILQGLQGLQIRNIVSRNLSSKNVLFDAVGKVKLTGFAVYELSGCGLDVNFPVGDPVYYAPEVIRAGPHNSDSDASMLRSSHQADIWAFGVLIVEMILGHRVAWYNDEKQARDPSATLQGILQLCGYKMKPLTNHLATSRRTSSRSNFGSWNTSTDESRLSREAVDGDVNDMSAHRRRIEAWLAGEGITARGGQGRGQVHQASQGKGTIAEISPDLMDLICETLAVNPEDRPDATQLLGHKFFASVRSQHPSVSGTWMVKPALHSAAVAGESARRTARQAGLYRDFYAWPTYDGLPLAEILQHWRLAGGDFDTDFVLAPPIRTLPTLVRVHGTPMYTRQDVWTLEDPTIYCVPLQHIHCIAMLRCEHTLVSSGTESSASLGDDTSVFNGTFYAAHARLAATLRPPIKRGRDPGKYEAIVARFRSLLAEYPRTTRQIIQLAHKGIPDDIRLEVYCAILGVQTNSSIVYDLYDKEQPSSVDRQIDVDIPRCHQYHAALSSPAGHNALRRILKTWVEANPDCAYAQGLDQLAGPLLALEPNEEAKVYCCLQEMVVKYTHSFYQPGTSRHLQHYLHTFIQVLAYWDPQLAAHLDDTKLDPELYAIPWFMTLFSHVLRIPKIYTVWDALLLGPSALTIFFGVTAMMQIREKVLPLDFHDSSQFFSKGISNDTLDVDAIVKDGIAMYHHTPPSALSARLDTGGGSLGAGLSSTTQRETDGRWWENPLSLDDRKAELCPRISMHDLMVFRDRFLVVDVRSESDFRAGHMTDARSAPDGGVTSLLSELVKLGDDVHVCLVGDDAVSTRDAANSLVRVRIKHISILNGGMDAIWKDAPHLITMSL